MRPLRNGSVELFPADRIVSRFQPVADRAMLDIVNVVSNSRLCTSVFSAGWALSVRLTYRRIRKSGGPWATSALYGLESQA